MPVDQINAPGRPAEPPANSALSEEQARINRAFQRADARLADLQKRGMLHLVPEILRQREQLRDPNDPTSDQAFRDRAELAKMEGPEADGPVARTARAAALGVAKAGIETKDFIAGEPAEGEKSDIRRSFEAQDRALRRESAGYGLASDVSQITAGLIGAGKLLAPLKLANYSRVGAEVATGAVAGAVAIDPHEERLSNLVEAFPELHNPITGYLAADPADSDAEGRLKNALEGIGADFALIGAVKIIKLLRLGRNAEAAKEIDALEQGRPAGEPQAPNASRDAPVPARDAQPADGLASPQTSAKAAAEDVAPDAGEAAQQASLSPAAAPTPEATTARPQAQLFEVTPDTASAILKGTADEMAAIAKYGSREAAAEAGAAISRGARLPWHKLAGPEEVRVFLDNAAQALKPQMDAIKGGSVLSDTAVSSKVREIADFFGDSPELVIGELAQAGRDASDMVARMEAGYLTANAMTQDAYVTATKIRNGLLQDWGGDALRAEETLRAQLKASMNLLASARAISSSSGRALRRMRGSFAIAPADLERVNTMNGRQLADLLHFTKGDPKLLAQAVNPTFLRRVMNETTFLLQNNLLWNYPTHVWNITSSMLMTVGRPTEKLLGSFAIRGGQGSIIRRQALKEYAATVSALGDGWGAMVEAFKRGDSALSPHNAEFFQGNTASTALPKLAWKRMTSVTDMAENAFMAINYRTIIGLPTRALGSVDEFFKTIRYRAVVQAQAAVEAEDLGLRGADLQAYIGRKLEAAIDPATGQARDAKALREAQIATFQQELFPKSMGASIQQFRGRHPILHLVLPFVKTPINVLRYGWKLTPGLNLIQKEFQDAILGKVGTEAQAQAIGQMTLGSVFMGLAAALTINGKVTGPGPAKADLKQQLGQTGWKPFSYVIDGPDGTRRYIPIGRTDPVGLAFSTVATLVEAMRMDTDDQDGGRLESGIMALGIALAQNFADRTFLQNINQAVQALAEPEGRGERWLANTAANLVPASSLLRGVNPDPYLREARTMVDAITRTIPGYSETLPPVRDVFGDPVVRQLGLTSGSDADLVEAEHSRIMLETGKSIGRPDWTFEGLDLRDITLTKGKNAGRNAYDVFAEMAGHLPGARPLKQELAKIIRSPVYQDLPDGDPEVKGTRIRVLANLTQSYRKAAKRLFIRENEELHPLIGARQKQARGAALLKRNQRQQPQEPGARALLDALTP